jgi:hypothetical protein
LGSTAERGRVERLVQAQQPNPEVLQLVVDGQQVAQVAGQAVDLGEQNHVEGLVMRSG